MSTTLPCPQCGVENPLGRVFCPACGGRLNFARPDEENLTLEERLGIDLRKWGRRLLSLCAIGFVVCVALALWPRARLLGEQGKTVGARRALTRMKTLANVAEGRSLGANFAEADINAYLAHYKAKRLKLASFSVEVLEEHCKVRIVRSLGTVDFGIFEVDPTFSYDLTCVAYEGRLYVRKASIGHLPLRGFLKKPAVSAVRRHLAGESEARLLAEVDEIEMSKGQVSLVIKR